MKPVLTFLCLVCLSGMILPLMGEEAAPSRTTIVVDRWPAEFEGRPLTQLPLTDLEESYVNNGFPGAIGRFTDGERVLILRQITRPSRRVHSIALCFSGAGWHVEWRAPVRDQDDVIWSRFDVTINGDTLRVRESYRDAWGATSYPDLSAWYWAAATGKSVGPWLAVTVVEPVAEE